MAHRKTDKLSEIRKQTTCMFIDGVSFSEFETIAKVVAARFTRIKEVTVNNAEITCKVNSMTGYTEWFFSVDFNNWGHISDVYWTYTENTDSKLAQSYGAEVSSEIIKLLSSKFISLPLPSIFFS